MTFQEWYEGAGGEQARAGTSLCVPETRAVMMLLLEQAYAAGGIEGLRQGKEIYCG